MLSVLLYTLYTLLITEHTTMNYTMHAHDDKAIIITQYFNEYNKDNYKE